MEKGKDNLPILLFETEQHWVDWLEKNGTSPGVWVKIAKKKSGVVSIDYQQALDIALCYGWIDGLKKSYDEKCYIQRFTARKPKSNWSKINREKAERFIAEGKMKPEGLALIDHAKKTGAWERAYDTQSTATVPDDLAAAFKKNKDARAFFDTLDSVNRYAILYRIQVARSEKLRAKKIQDFIDMLNRKEKIHNHQQTKE